MAVVMGAWRPGLCTVTPDICVSLVWNLRFAWRNRNSGPSSPQPSRRTDYATPAFSTFEVTYFVCMSSEGSEFLNTTAVSPFMRDVLPQNWMPFVSSSNGYTTESHKRESGESFSTEL